MINESINFTMIHITQPKVIYYLSYPEKLVIATICVLFWYFFCCAIKREFKRMKKEKEKK